MSTIMTFSRQATLGKFLIGKRDSVIKEIKSGQACFAALQSATLNPDQKTFLHVAYLGAVYSIFEGYLLDIASETLSCFPEKLKNSDVKVRDALEGTALFLDQIVEKQVGQLGYQSFDDISVRVSSYFTSKPFANPSINIVKEFKATRDIYVHNQGMWNATYARKAGANARAEPRGGRKLPIDAAYLQGGVDALIDFVKAFHAHGPRKMEGYNRAKAFKGMWQLTWLENLIPFDQAWHLDMKADMVRPKPRALKWAWSGSEKMLFDFFLSVFSDSHPAITTKMQDVFTRWPATTLEGQIVINWLENPFSF